MTEVLPAPVRGSRHRSISPHRRLELGKDYSPYRSSSMAPSGKPPLVRAATNSSIVLRQHNRQREESPLLTSRREAKKSHKDLHIELESEVSPLGITPLDSQHTHRNILHRNVLDVKNNMAHSSPCLPKLSSPVSTPPGSRRRAWTMGSNNKHLKGALNNSPGSSPAIVRKKRNSSSPKFNFTSLPSSRQSSPKSSTSQGITNSKTVTFIPKANKYTPQHQETVESNTCISKNEKNVHIISSAERSDIVNEQEKSEVRVFVVNKNLESETDGREKSDQMGENPNANSDSISSSVKKSLPEGLSEDVYEKCLHWLKGVRAADDDKCLDVVTQPDLQWKD